MSGTARQPAALWIWVTSVPQRCALSYWCDGKHKATCAPVHEDQVFSHHHSGCTTYPFCKACATQAGGETKWCWGFTGWSALGSISMMTPLELPCVFTSYNQDCPLNASFNHCRKDKQQIDFIFLNFWGSYLQQSSDCISHHTCPCLSIRICGLNPLHVTVGFCMDRDFALQTGVSWAK